MNQIQDVVVAPPPALAPVLDQERLLNLDVLRAFALLGVVVANVWLWFSGIAFRFPAYRDQLQQLSLDTVVFVAIAVLVSGKAMSTFSFLFGLGFAVQMSRAQARGRSIVPVYLRRLTVLLLIGAAHMFLFWYGDILTTYAVLGFALVLFRKRADRTLLVWAAILLLAVPLLMGGLPWILSATGSPMPPPNVTEIAQRHANTLAVFQGGSYGEIVRENALQASQFYAGRKAPWVLYILGIFLLGLYAGRRRMFEQVDEHRQLFRRLAAWGIAIGLGASIVSAVVQQRVPPSAMFADPRLILVMMLLFLLGTVPLAAGYVSTVVLLLQRPEWNSRLSFLAPVGRMALTNYLSQTLIMLTIFYPVGGGLIGRTGPTVGLLIALAVFALQIVWSRAWLSHFQFGPMEWLWRSLTYGTLQPMRIKAREPVVAV